MRVHFVGTGNVFSRRLSPCIVIDNCILLEMPNGAVKALKNADINFSNISICLLSHLHADHVFDIPFFLLNKYYDGGKKVVLVGSKGIKAHIEKLCEVAYPTLDWDTIQKQTINEIIELSNDEHNLQLLEYSISAIKVIHGEELSFGYRVENSEAKSFCYTGDTIYCDALEKLFNNTTIICVEMNDFQCTPTHMGYLDLERIFNFNKNRTIYAVHTPDAITSMDEIKGPIYFPKDNSNVEV